MQRLFELILPMAMSVGVFLIAGTLVVAVVRNRLLRALLMGAGFVMWVAWVVEYTTTTMVS